MTLVIPYPAKIWSLCEENGIWLTAAHIAEKENVSADYESRNNNLHTELMLNPQYLFPTLKGFAFIPQIDLFASRINKQFAQYVSYRPDPFASYIHSFTITLADKQFIVFLPSVVYSEQ